jgi:hypothetical protein
LENLILLGNAIDGGAMITGVDLVGAKLMTIHLFSKAA